MKANDLVTHLGGYLGIPRLQLNAEGVCAVRMADGLELDIQVQDVCEELRLTLPLGRPDASQLENTLAEALMANTLLASTSSRHLAWETSTEYLVLCQTLRFDQLNPTGLAQEIDDFFQACRMLRLQLQQDGVFST